MSARNLRYLSDEKIGREDVVREGLFRRQRSSMGRRADRKAEIKGMCRPRAVCEELKVVQVTRLSHAGGNTVDDSGEVKGCCKVQYTIADRALGGRRVSGGSRPGLQ